MLSFDEKKLDCHCVNTSSEIIVGDDIAAKDYILKMIPKIKRESSRTILKHLLKDDIEKIIKFTLMLWRICK